MKYTDNTQEQTIFDKYRAKRNEEYETGLYTLADATAKAVELLDLSGDVQDIITRGVSWDNRDIEICDFVACNPVGRVNGDDTKYVYEVMSVEKNIEAMTVNLTLRKVKNYDITEYDYSVLVDENGAFCVGINNDTTIALDEVA